MYHLTDRLHTLYGFLQDEQSKSVFAARFAVDMEQSIPNILRLASLGSYEYRGLLGQKDILEKLNRERKKIILYGTGYTGRFIANVLQSEHIAFYGFCGRNAEKFPNGLLGKPVLSPDEIVAHGGEYYIVPTVGTKSYPEICEFLQKSKFPEDHILDRVDIGPYDNEKQYFEFPELYRRGTAFIDGGCFDCESSYRFAKWCGGEYSFIFAFEPDPDNYSKCCKRAEEAPLPNFQLVNAGLSDRDGTAMFDSQNINPAGSHIIPAEPCAGDIIGGWGEGETVSIRTATIDSVVGDRTVGFIKMDIEGAEFYALHGAKDTIIRDRPFLAICVYHLRGDVCAIMDYLHQLVPEYRFLLRHYSTFVEETVLYASVDL